MREFFRWTLPGLVVVGPLQLWGHGWVLLVAAPVIGFVLQQAVRAWFEGRGNGFRNPTRPALDVIIERGQLQGTPNRGDLAYQAYEVVFYQRPDWQAARDHMHRCWDIIFLCWSTALGSALGMAISLLGLAIHTGLAGALLIGLGCATVILRTKGRQTLAALHLFDRALVVTHWPLYAAVLEGFPQGTQPRQDAASRQDKAIDGSASTTDEASIPQRR